MPRLSFIKRLIKAVVILPLTAGNSTPGGKCYDGRISTILIMGTIASVSVVVMVINTRHKHGESTLNSYTYAIITACDILGGLSMIVLGFCARKLKTGWIEALKENQKAPKLKIIFIWIFGFIIILQSLSMIWTNSQCNLNDSINSMFTTTQRITWNCLTMVCICLQIVFISYFSNFTFCASFSSHLGIIFVVSGNMAAGVYTFVKMSEDLFIPSHNFTTVGFNYGDTHLALFANSSSCLDHAFYNKVYIYIKPFLRPITVEYCLLAIGLMFGFWSSTKTLNVNILRTPARRNCHSTNDSYETMNYQSIATNDVVTINSHSCNDCEGTINYQSTNENERFINYQPIIGSEGNVNYVSTNENEETRSLVPSTNDIEYTRSMLSDNLDLQEFRNINIDSGILARRKKCMNILIVLLGILITTPVYTVTALLVFSPEPNEDFRSGSEWLYVTFCMILLLTDIAALYKLQEDCVHIRENIPLSGTEYIFIVTCFADVAYSTFGILACACSCGTLADLLCVQSVILICVDYLQAILVLQARRSRKQSSSSYFGIEHACMLLVLLNGCRWLVGSLTEIKYPFSTIQEDSFTRRFWTNVVYIVFPIANFYRFHTFIDAHQLYKTFKI